MRSKSSMLNSLQKSVHLRQAVILALEAPMVVADLASVITILNRSKVRVRREVSDKKFEIED